MSECLVEPSDVNSNVYKMQYHEDFVDKWDELIDWDARAESEEKFFVKLLKERGVEKVLDAATGTGFHSISLLNEGFNVHSVDGSLNMLQKATENAQKYNKVLRTIHSDWRDLCSHVNEKYDAVLCLGNSFTHLFEETDRRKTLAEFYSVLKPEGVLILDQRNYDVMLNEGFKTKHTYYYAGEGVSAYPVEISDANTLFKYEFPDNSTFELNMFPLRRAYTNRLMLEAGFSGVKTYGDFEEDYKLEETDFLIHLAEKKGISHEEGLS